MRHFLLFACLAAILASGAPVFSMELTDFTSRCTMGLGTQGNDTCTERADICDAFLTLMQDAKDAVACKQVCSDAQASLRPRHITDGCEASVQNAYSECTIYCQGLQ